MPVYEALRHLSLCHSVVIDPIDGGYSAASPDEQALVEGAKQMDFEFVKNDRSENN